MLAEIQVRRGDKETAKEALKKCVDLAPDKRLHILNESAFEGLW